MKKTSFTYLIALLFLIGCSASNKTFTEQEVILKKLSIEKYGVSFNLIYNSEKSYSAVVKQERISIQNPNPVLQFFIYDLAEEKIIFEDTVTAGKFNWRDNDQIEISVTPGMISAELNINSYGYLYNIKLKTKSDINSSSQNPNR